ncbi:MAG: LysR family transcriptional regulator [Betaproteobacteria bacterium RIFCSPLOWO2_12_FULL_67_28]|nr:MAG: LysR family transcriptional regulator [Betaproteobacteria bacterium RIFCSPLOWO2_12_FULL_67_28]
MDRFQAMAVFVKVVEQGSFARAAGRLGISTSACSRQIADLERHLDARLLHRTTRRLSLTESGQSFHERCVQLLADLEEAEIAAAASTATPRGTIRLTCSINFGVRHLSPAIGAFLARHPEVRFDVALSDRIVDLVDEGYDMAVRIGGTGGANVVARRLGETRVVCCAAPDYLERHGTPHSPEELAKHRCLTYEYLQSRNLWQFRDRSGRERPVRVSGPLHSNNGDLLAAAAVQGVGIALEPGFIVGADLKAGRLVPLLESYAAPVSPIYAVYASRRYLSAKVRAFVDFLAGRFASPQNW